MNRFSQQNEDEVIDMHGVVVVAGKQKEVGGDDVQKVSWIQNLNALECHLNCLNLDSQQGGKGIYTGK